MLIYMSPYSKKLYKAEINPYDNYAYVAIKEKSWVYYHKMSGPYISLEAAEMKLRKLAKRYNWKVVEE